MFKQIVVLNEDLVDNKKYVYCNENYIKLEQCKKCMLFCSIENDQIKCANDKSLNNVPINKIIEFSKTIPKEIIIKMYKEFYKTNLLKDEGFE